MKNSVLLCVMSCLINQLIAQKPMLLLEINPKSAIVGEPFEITVKSNIQGEIELDFPNGFVQGYNMMSGSTVDVDYNTGRSISYFYSTQTGAMSKAGTFKIGPAYIKRGNKTYRSNTVSITIAKEEAPEKHAGSSEQFSAHQLRQPAFGVIEKSKSVLYEGEPLVLNAKVYALFNATQIENYEPYELKGGLGKHEIADKHDIQVNQEHINGTPYYTFECDKKVVFPSKLGKSTIEPYKLMLIRGFDGMELISSPSTIEVKPLPKNSPADFTGGVGSFSISSSIKDKNLQQGDVFSLVVTVQGHGNLHTIQQPIIDLPTGCVLYGDPIIKEAISYNTKGATGKITYQYNVQAANDGNVIVPASHFSYFDPEMKKYVSISAQQITLDVVKNPQFNANQPQEGNTIVATPTQNSPTVLSSSSNNDFFKSIGFWVGVSSPFALALLLGFYWKFKHTPSNQHSTASAQTESQPQEKSVVSAPIVSPTDLLKEAEIAWQHGKTNNGINLIEKALILRCTQLIQHDNASLLSKAQLLEQLKEKSIPTALIDELKSIFATCEEACYCFGISSTAQADLLAQAKRVMQSIG